jgi:hypothetical protein
MAELAAMRVRTSQYHPGKEIPEKNLFYRLAKRLWFSDFGSYRGMDHTKSSAPGIIAASASSEVAAG